jgi:hypothetical protein
MPNIKVYRQRYNVEKVQVHVTMPLDMYDLAMKEVMSRNDYGVKNHMDWATVQDYILFLVSEDIKRNRR